VPFILACCATVAVSVADLAGSEVGLGSQQTWVQIITMVTGVLLALLFLILSRVPSSRAGVASTARWEKPGVALQREPGPGAQPMNTRWRSVDGYKEIDML
jgi:hypothetical protein